MGTLAGFPYLTDPWVVIGVNLDAIGTATYICDIRLFHSIHVTGIWFGAPPCVTHLYVDGCESALSLEVDAVVVGEMESLAGMMGRRRSPCPRI